MKRRLAEHVLALARVGVVTGGVAALVSAAASELPAGVFLAIVAGTAWLAVEAFEP